ncbi:hypothetical protein C8J56DRAFT_970588 [Mycena floridula]|nr:hypothetical protein C8J56DRAFT_970588 [Mycena floridula]
MAPKMQLKLACHVCGFSGKPAEPAAMIHSPRIQWLLQSNETPLDSELAQFQEYISAEKRAVVDLDDKITEMRQRLALLVAEREQKERNIADCQILVNPVRRLPPDILNEIFLAFVLEEDYHKNHRSTSLDPRDAPWTITQVSSRWREVAICHPPLRATVRIAYLDKKQLREPALHKDILALTAQLDRANRHRLDVFIFLDIPVPIHNSVLAILAATSIRWRSLFFVTLSHNTTILRLIRGTLKCLVDLELHLCDSGGTPMDRDACSESTMGSNLEYMPNLHILASPPEVILGCNLPVSQVTNYTCDKLFSAPQMLQILSKMPLLESCTIESIRDSVPMSLKSPPLLELIHLHTLDLPSGFIELPLSCSFPALRDLFIHNNDCDMKTLVSFVKSSKATLEKLHITGTSLKPSECILLLKNFPTLRSLNIGMKGVFDINKLIGTLTLAPSLIYLRLRHPDAMVLDDATVERLREARPNFEFSAGRRW